MKGIVGIGVVRFGGKLREGAVGEGFGGGVGDLS